MMCSAVDSPRVSILLPARNAAGTLGSCLASIVRQTESAWECNFSRSCAFRNRPGDACVAVPVSWDSTDTRTNTRGQVAGIDHVAAAYSVADSRWWLCSSDFQGAGTLTNSCYSSR